MKLAHILPFMESNELKELALKIVNNEVEGVKIAIIYPFLSNEDLDEVVEALIKDNKGKELTQALPFVSEESLNKIFEAIKAGTIEGLKEQALYPFLGKDKIKEMFDILVKECQEKAKEHKEEE